jgi:hypothetical protein
MTKKIFCLLIICSITFFFQSYGQVGIGYARLKDFKALGFNTFLNFSLPVSESNYVTLEGGLQYFKNSYDEELAYIPILVGYKYTLNQTGTGFYIEPHAGYAFGESTIQTYDEYGIISDGNGNLIYQEVKGPMAGLGFGYFYCSGNQQNANEYRDQVSTFICQRSRRCYFSKSYKSILI